jgi:hypothetical protein
MRLRLAKRNAVGYVFVMREATEGFEKIVMHLLFSK